MALCQGMGAAAAMEQRCLGLFHTPGMDDGKRQGWGKTVILGALHIPFFVTSYNSFLRCIQLSFFHVSSYSFFSRRKSL